MKNILYQESIVEIKHLFRMMRNTLLALFVFAGTAFATESYSQTMKVTVVADNMSTGKVISEIEKQTDYLFVYNVNEVNLKRNVKVNAQNKSVAEVLNKVFEGTDIYYAMEGKNIMLMSKAKNGEVAQQANKVTGIVKDTNGEPIIGANVTVKGQSIGTITDIDGRFVLDAPKDAVLQITYIGYVSQEVKVSGKKELNVVLKEDAETLDEVVVVGYGTMKKTDLTGAVMQVKTNDIKSVTTGNPLQALQGRAPGVSVMTNNIPGESPTMRIRGSGSISAGNDPLYVVDGFPLMNGSISEVNANDIASIEVLKDASATAIYGSRGANGVVMITTKTGAKNAKNLSFNATYGFQMPGRLIETMNHEQFVDFINTAYTNAKGRPVYTAANPAPDIHTDWQDEIIKDSAPVQDYSISFDGTTGDTQYMVSGGMFLQDGLISSAKFDKYTFRSNIQHKFNRFLTIGSHLQYAYTEQAKAGIANTAGSLSSIWRSGWPTLPVKNEDGSFAIPADNPAIAGFFSDDARWNPIANYGEVTNTRTTSRLFGDVYAELKITKDLTFKTNFGIDIANVRNYNYGSSKQTTATGSGNGGNGYIKELSRITENILTYTKNWDEHRFSATGVYSWQDYVYENLSISGKGFQNDETGAWDMGLADRETMSYASGKYGNTLISFTGRFTYAYKDRYLMTATARYDGSSRFGTNNKWGFFPSVGLGWRISEETFLANNKVITNLKLRGSYGITGNQEIGNYKSLAQLKSKNYIYNDALMQGFYETIGNPDLKWERTKQFDLGFDLSLWNRIHLNVDYYSRRTSDLLYDVPIPSTSGFSTMLSNIGIVSNKGVEIALSGRIVETKDFKLDATVNISKNKNEIKELYNDVESITVTSGLGLSKYLKVGESLLSIYGLKSEGIIKTEEQLAAYQKIVPTAQLGDEMYADIDDDKAITAKDQINIGETEPNFFYGVALNLEYKKFHLDILGQGAHDFAAVGASNSDMKIGIHGYGDSFNYLLVGENQTDNRCCLPSKYAYERMWSPSNPNGTFPRAGASNLYLSDRSNSEWNYFIIKSIALSYDFGNNPIKGIKGIKGISAFVNLQNFITFANHRGYNPENGDPSHPWIKTITIGVNAKF